MSQTGTSTKQQKSDAGVTRVTMNIEVDVIPVSDVERSKQFYQRLGWRLDADDAPAKDVRIVQFTPPGSGCSVTFGKGITAASPGSAAGALVVSDILAAHQHLVGRFASLERAILSQFEVGAGFVPGGGPMARLPRLIGRGRALEVLLGADDIPGDLAERYGYVNRTLPDAELDAFVEALAVRIASFDKQAIVETKNFVNIASLPPDAEIAPEWDACFASVQRPAAQRRINTLLERGLHKPGDVENRLGYYVGQVGR